MAPEPPAGSDPAAPAGAGRLATPAPERADAIATASNQADVAKRSGGATDAFPERLDVSTEIRNADGAGRPRETDGAGQRRNADGAVQPAATAGLSAATPVPALDRGYWLQLGAFSSAGNANSARERLSRQLTHLGAPIDVVADGGLFKLQAGPWPTQEAARAAADRVRAQAEVQAFPIQR